jgi:lipid-A-disaccharide synthase-like uncharacterized protein
VPALNEQDNVRELIEQVQLHVLGAGISCELIVVDDGSTDQTLPRLRALAADRPWLRLLHRDKPRGQSAAMHAGIQAAAGRYVATLDADLQNDPADLPKMLAKLEESGCDFAQGYRANRRDSLVKKVTSRVGRAFRKGLLNDPIRDTGCSTRVVTADLAKRFPLHFKGMHRFLPVYANMLGARIVEQPVNHRPRTAGQTKYGILNRAFVGLADCLAMRWMLKRYKDWAVQDVQADPQTGPPASPPGSPPASRSSDPPVTAQNPEPVPKGDGDPSSDEEAPRMQRKSDQETSYSLFRPQPLQNRLLMLLLVGLLGLCLLSLAWRIAPPTGYRSLIHPSPSVSQLDPQLPLDRCTFKEDGRGNLMVEAPLPSGERVLLSLEQFGRSALATQQGQREHGYVFTLLNITSYGALAWVAIGVLGQVLFTGRMLVQWLISERKKQSVVPPIFWWMSLGGASMLIIYFIWRKDIVGVLGQSTGWFIYIRNLWMIYRPQTSPAKAEALPAAQAKPARPNHHGGAPTPATAGVALSALTVAALLTGLLLTQ